MINKKTIKIRPDLCDTRTWKEEESIGVTCDICSESCENTEATKTWGLEGSKKEYDYVELKATWGYHSDYDGEIWEAHVCTKCIKQHLFPLIKFNVRDYLYDNIESGFRVNGIMEYKIYEDFVLPPTGSEINGDPYEL